MNYRGPFQVRADRNRREPEIKHPYDDNVRVTRSLVCGSDLHLYHGLVPDTRGGMTFGHEFTGIVEKEDQVYGPDLLKLCRVHSDKIEKRHGIDYTEKTLAFGAFHKMDNRGGSIGNLESWAGGINHLKEQHLMLFTG